MKQVMIIMALLFSINDCLASPQKREGFSWDSIRSWAIQDRGRVKPYDTFARESMVYITGKNQWKGSVLPK